MNVMVHLHDVEKVVLPLRARVAELEAELAEAKKADAEAAAVIQDCHRLVDAVLAERNKLRQDVNQLIPKVAKLTKWLGQADERYGARMGEILDLQACERAYQARIAELEAGESKVGKVLGDRLKCLFTAAPYGSVSVFNGEENARIEYTEPGWFKVVCDETPVDYVSVEVSVPADIEWPMAEEWDSDSELKRAIHSLYVDSRAFKP